MIIDKLKDENYEIIIKTNYIYIKNYIKVVDINRNKIIIETKNCMLNISGNNLLIVQMDQYDLAIKGNLKGIDFNNEK